MTDAADTDNWAAGPEGPHFDDRKIFFPISKCRCGVYCNGTITIPHDEPREILCRSVKTGRHENHDEQRKKNLREIYDLTDLDR